MPGRLGLSVANVLLTLPSRRVRRYLAVRYLGWHVGHDVWIGRGLRVYGFGGVTIGSRVVINPRCAVDGRGGLTIGDDVAIAAGVTILSADHDPDSATRQYRTREVTIGDRVWLAAGAWVLPGTAVGDGAVIGAAAVASRRVEPWTIYAGNPAQAVRARSDTAQRTLRAVLPRWS